MRLLTALWLLCCLPAAAQTKKAIVSGIITNEEGYRVAGASVTILGKKNGVASTDSGTFSIQIPAKSAIALVFSHTGYESQQKNFFMNAGEQEFITIRLKSLSATLEEVLVTDNRQQNENSLVKINPRNASLMPGATSGVEGLIKTLVGSNNELTSQYNVRGGNFDENLVYINDFEVFRPYLVSSGQQEGLSIINPEMTRSVLFYTGGFQARYGDKMSSVLDIQYKKPVRFGGTAYAGLLEQGFHL
nr:carboxypeptidase-like regulatory domain-containing protein [Ferruginibacter sp.]